MKKIVFLSAIGIALFSACADHKAEIKNKVSAVDTTLQFFGEKITTDGAVAADQLIAQMQGKDSLKIKLTGSIEEVCQKKGCWMDIITGEGKTMKVSFKDYSFFVPKNAKGKTAIFEGLAYTDTIPVNQLRHYAEDEGKTKEEIAKITKPEISISFEARGVIIKK